MVSYFGSLLGKSSSPHNTSIHICLFRITESCQWTFSVPSQNSWCPKNSKNSRLKVSLFPKTPIFSTWCTGIQLLFMATLPSKVGPLWRWFGNPGFLAHVTCVSPEIQLVLKCNQISFWMVVSNIVFFSIPIWGSNIFSRYVRYLWIVPQLAKSRINWANIANIHIYGYIFIYRHQFCFQHNTTLPVGKISTLYLKKHCHPAASQRNQAAWIKVISCGWCVRRAIVYLPCRARCDVDGVCLQHSTRSDVVVRHWSCRRGVS